MGYSIIQQARMVFRIIGGDELKNIKSVEYDIALNIITGMLQKGLISQSEFEKIDAENKRTFIMG